MLIQQNYVKQMDDLTLFLYATTKLYMVKNVSTLNVPMEKFYYDAYKALKPNKQKRQMMQSALENLQNLGLLQVGNPVTVYPPKFYGEIKDYFVEVYEDELAKIMESGKHSPTKWAIFHQFCRILCSLNGNIFINGRSYVIGHMPLNYFAKAAGVDKITISNYNKCLKDLGLIYIRSSGDVSFRNNFYGRYKDKGFIDEYVKQRKEF